MRPPSPLPAALLAAALLLGAGCSPPPPATDSARELFAFLGEAAGEWADAETEARGALAAGEWDRAGAAWERRIALYPSPGPDAPRPRVVEFQVSVDLYNLACARALGGKAAAALDALEQALAGGAGFVGFDHLVGDPDLRALREEPRWEALLRRLSWTAAGGGAGPGRRGGRPPPRAVRRGGAAGGVATGEVVTAVPRPPYAVSPGISSWTTRLDRGERAAEKVGFAVERAGRAWPLDPARRVLLAVGAGEAAVAWEVLLRRPDLFSGAVIAGPAPAAWDLLDRGAEKVRARILVVGEGAAPDPAVPLKTGKAASVEAALAELLR